MTVGAPLRRLLAYVWPAIALGPIGEALVLPLGVRLARLADPASAPLADLAHSLSVSLENVGASTASQPAAKSSRPNVAHPDPFSFTPNTGGMSLIATLVTVLAALIGVVALARLTVGEDLFSTRWLH